jgi:hypothetical protein
VQTPDGSGRRGILKTGAQRGKRIAVILL